MTKRKIVVRIYKLVKRAFAKFRWKRLWGARLSRDCLVDNQGIFVINWCFRYFKPGSPWFEFLVMFDFFAPWHRKGREASSVKVSLKIRRKRWSNVPPNLLACLKRHSRIAPLASKMVKWGLLCHFFFQVQHWKNPVAYSGRLRHVQLPWTGDFGFWHFHSS